MTLYAELVSEWMDSFPIMAHVSDRMDHIYADHIPVVSSQNQHKEELSTVVFRMHMIRILFMQKLKNILTLWKTIVLILTGQIAQTNVNVADSILIGEKMEREYIASLPNGFFNPFSSPITTMSVSKKQVKDKQFRLVIDLESIFLWLLMIGQQRQMEIKPLFACELYAVPPSHTDEHRCLRRATSQTLSNVLGYPRLYHVLLKLSLWMFHSCFTILCGLRYNCIHQKSFKSATNICQLISSHTTGTSPSHVMEGNQYNSLGWEIQDGIPVPKLIRVT